MVAFAPFLIYYSKTTVVFRQLNPTHHFLITLATAFLSWTAIASVGLKSLEEINAFTLDPTHRRESFELTGKVLSATAAPNTGVIVLTDDTGARGEFFRFLNLSQPEPGDTVKASGIARIDEKHEPYIRIDGLNIIEHGPCPEPLDTRLSEADAGLHHLLVIRTEGVVIDVFQDEIDKRYTIILLKDADTIVPVIVNGETFGDCRNLIDATLRVTGIYRRNGNGVRKFAWPNIIPGTPDDIEVIAPPPADQFAVPVLEQRLYLTADEIARMGKRSVTGEVLATWSGIHAMVRTEDGRIVNLQFTKEVPLPRCGEFIVAAGLPETDLFRLNLTSARWKPAPEPITSKADEPVGTLSDISFVNDKGQVSIGGEAYGELISVRGVILTLPLTAEDRRFILDAGEREIYIDMSSIRDAKDLAVGSEIQVTGRCLLLSEGGSRAYGAAKVTGIALVIRKAEDIVVLSRPPWWTPVRLLFLIALLVLALVGIAIWNLIQKHLSNLKISERTRLAVEIHDTLSQNLAGVACQISAGSLTLDENPMAAKPLFNAAEKMLQSCRTELKNCLFDLRSDMLEEPHFETAVLKALSQLTEETAVAVRFIARRSDFSDTVAHAILSVIRELTANAVRHGHAGSVRIAGCTDAGRLMFSVTDDGIGFDPLHCAGIPEGHFGLSGIRDRLKRLNGSIDIRSAPGKGTKATVSLPMPRK